jgi:aspartate ammonia-lyase
MRTEKDFLGEVSIPEDALYGINALRASQNFDNDTQFSIEWYKAIGQVKQACYLTVLSFIAAAQRKYPGKPLPRGCEDITKIEMLCSVAAEVAEGVYFSHFIIPAMQGGAGTAINMNINEIITNASLIKLGYQPGDYSVIDPFAHANIFQSTNDVVPSALKVAMMKQLNLLEICINQSRTAFEIHERTHRDALRIGYTQMQEAVPSSFGLLFSAWSDALSRDWWRVSKCFERIKVINLGGGATGTAMAIPRYFVMEVTNRLRELTHLPVTRSENHTDTTQNLDSFVEVHAILKAHAVNLEKIASDLRLLGSDLMGQHEVSLPQKQTGSSIMPGKVNPVINEFVISCAHKVYTNDMLISNLCAQGTLELNAYLPTIGHAMLESLHLLIKANESMLSNMIEGLSVESHTAYDKLMSSPSITTALVPLLGYEKASQLARLMKSGKLSIFEANQEMNFLDDHKLKKALLPENLLKTGFSLNDI